MNNTRICQITRMILEQKVRFLHDWLPPGSAGRLLARINYLIYEILLRMLFILYQCIVILILGPNRTHLFRSFSYLLYINFLQRITIQSLEIYLAY